MTGQGGPGSPPTGRDDDRDALREAHPSDGGRAGERSGRPPRPRREHRPEGGGEGWRPFVRDLLTSVVAVLVVGVYLFTISGVWPPLVAVESGSMMPNMQPNDLVFVMDEARFSGEAAVAGTGVVTAESADNASYSRFHGPGDVIVFVPDGDDGETPIIHRARFWVEEGERWLDRADPRFTGRVGSCDEVPTCPADHAGFITKGDANGEYDQLSTLPSCDGPCDPVKPSWIAGTAEVRIPGLGWLRLRT